MARNINLALSNLKTAGAIIGRTAVFLGCFVVASGVLGVSIIDNHLSLSYGFQYYGGSGKSLLFGCLALLLLIWRKGQLPTLGPWKLTNLWYLTGAVACVALGLASVNELVGSGVSWWAVPVHVCIWGTVLLLLTFSFGATNLRLIYQRYRREIWTAIGLSVAFSVFLSLVYGLWTYMASIVLNSVRELLGFAGLSATYDPPRTLLLDKFGVTIAEFCSGIDSIALFAGLYALVGVLDWDRFDHRRYMLAFIPGLLVLFGFNIIRVFGLIVGGYYINPQIAFSLFHTYAGMVFFIIYSGLFWGVAYKWMLMRPTNRRAS